MSAIRSLIVLGLLLGVAILIAVTSEGDAEPPEARPDAPNVIVIMTDDQALNTWNRKVMPRTFERIVDQGTLFENGFAVPPLCCPARATLMTGRYPQNHGVATNRYNALIDPEDVLPVWLSEAGYETMIAGKFLNGYEKNDSSEGGVAPAPGWDRWWVATGEERKYFDYEVSVDGSLVRFGSDREDYVTNAMTDAATEFMEEDHGEAPYFLWLAHAAPHQASRDRNERCWNSGPVPLPGDFRDAADFELPTDPSFFEEDVSDKPPIISRYSDGSAAAVARQELKYRCTVAALQAVDRSVERVFETLEDTGEDENTIVFFISDNGTYFGEHRKPGGKELAYDPSAKVPFAVMPSGGLDAGSNTSEVMTGTHDITPTILELAGLEGEHRTDGRSLVGPLSGQEGAWPKDRALVLEIGNPDRCMGYRALRTPSYVWIEHRELEGDECVVGFSELYDLRSDPFMLENRLAPPGEVEREDELKAAEMAERLATLNTCSGIEGRDAASDAPYCE